jgi:hypothetical protein
MLNQLNVITPSHPALLRLILNLKVAAFWVVAPCKSQQLVSGWDLNQTLPEW